MNALWQILSKEKYARWVAVNHLTASVHTDANHNNLFYFDPATGQLEPVISDMLGHGGQIFPRYKYRIWREFVPDPTIPMNERIYPLMDAALRNPTFYHRRNQILFEMIQGVGAAEQQRHELGEIFNLITDDVRADKYKTGLQNAFVGDFPFPYSNAQFEASKQILFDFIDKRQAFLLRELSKSSVQINVLQDQENGRTLFLAEVNGHAAAEFDVAPMAPSVFMDRNLNGTPTAKVDDKITLYPGVRVYEGTDWNLPTYGNGRHLVPGPQRYLFSVPELSPAESAARLKSAFRNAVTGEALEADIAIVPAIDRRGYAAKGAGIHAWQFSDIERRHVVLGPGTIDLYEDLIVPLGGSLLINGGTVIRLGPGRSIISQGPLTVDGRAHSPVFIERLDPGRAWGGIVVQGQGAAGSQIRHAQFHGGSLPTGGQAVYSGMVSFHDAGNTVIENSRFANNQLSDDTLHVVYGGVTIQDSEFSGCFGDCMDLDHTQSRLSGIIVHGAGNDGLDFMAGRAEITEVAIDGAGDKGISAGEGTHVQITGAQIENAQTGIAVKDDSRLHITDAVLHANAVAVDVFTKHPVYGGPGQVQVSQTLFDSNGVNIRTESGATITLTGQAVPPKVVGDGAVTASAP